MVKLICIYLSFHKRVYKTRYVSCVLEKARGYETHTSFPKTSNEVYDIMTNFFDCKLKNYVYKQFDKVIHINVLTARRSIY